MKGNTQRRCARRGRTGARVARVRNRAFTLIEAIVVTAIIAMMAALIVPNLVAIRHSQDLRNRAAAILRLPQQARNEAAKTHKPVVMRVENDAIVLERLEDPLDQNTGTNGTGTDLQTQNTPRQDPSDAQSDQTAQPVNSVPLGTDIQCDGAQLNGESTDTASWRWVVYPDGSAMSAGLTFRVGESGRQSLWMPADGSSARWINGDLPTDPTADRWPAGDLEQRTTTTQ